MGTRGPQPKHRINPLVLSGILSALLGGIMSCNQSGQSGVSRDKSPTSQSSVEEPKRAAPSPSVREPPDRQVPSQEQPKPARKELKASSPFVELPLVGFGSAIVSLPLGALSPKPIVVATHGNYDRPEWQCDVWREIIADRAFILCPRGVERPDSPSNDDIRFTYSNNQALEKEVLAGLDALRARYSDFIASGDVLYTGFSLGAIMGIAIATRLPSTFQRLVFIEGGHDRWTPASAKKFADGGGRRVLFICSQPGCVSDAKLAAARLEKAGVKTSVIRGPNAGHRYDGPIAEQTKQALSWVLEGDERWP